MKTGIVLCGGKSSRMGLPKAALPFGSETMLQRVVRLLSETVDGIVVVAADGQQLPELADNIRVVRDQRPERGPLEGLSAGLAACDKQTVSAYVTSCDVPFLVPEFVERMFQLLGDYEIAVPYDGKYHHPLSAVYRIEVLSYIETLLSNNRMRPVFLFDVAKNPSRLTCAMGGRRSSLPKSRQSKSAGGLPSRGAGGRLRCPRRSRRPTGDRLMRSPNRRAIGIRISRQTKLYCVVWQG